METITGGISCNYYVFLRFIRFIINIEDTEEIQIYGASEQVHPGPVR